MSFQLHSSSRVVETVDIPRITDADCKPKEKYLQNITTYICNPNNIIKRRPQIFFFFEICDEQHQLGPYCPYHDGTIRRKLDRYSFCSDKNVPGLQRWKWKGLSQTQTWRKVWVCVCVCVCVCDKRELLIAYWFYANDFISLTHFFLSPFSPQFSSR